ncbi:hypothetical protein D9M68_885660 [compost metagenome]
MILVGGILGRAIALALLGHDVNENGAGAGIADIVEYGQKMIEVMPVDRADIIEAEFLEQRAAGEERTREFFRAPGGLVQEWRQLADEVLGHFARAAIDRS